MAPTCTKRSVLNAGDRPHDVRRAALEVQSVAQAVQGRVLPSNRGAARSAGRPLNHGVLGAGPVDPLAQLARALNTLGRATSNSLQRPSGPVGWSGGRPNDTSGQTDTASSAFVEMKVVATVFTAAYTEPMDIPLPSNFRPITVIAGLISDPNDQSRYFRSGVACDWKLSSAANKLTLRSIDGMTIGDPTLIQYTFIYFGY